MRIDIITILPDLFTGPLNHSIVQRARDKGLVDIIIHNLRNYTSDRYKSVDDYTFGGGAGMVMKIEPIYNIIKKLGDERVYNEVIYTTPDAPLYSQKTANKLSLANNIIILCGHYKGVDQRVRDHLITMELSIGDYVMSGGELAAAVITDSVIRLIPGVISDETSALTDSYQDNLLAPPVYTRPAEFKGWKVPDVLISGHAGEIEKWRMDKSVERTKKIRPELLDDE
jgi:tRNA (guanine37-N1)-methyltransferase